MATDNSASRLVGALISPVPTFRSIGERPTWVAAFLALYLLTCATVLLAFQKVDFPTAMREQIEQQQHLSGHKMSPAELDKVERMAPFMKGISIAGVLVLYPSLFFLVPALFLVLNPLGGQLGYKQSLGVSLHASMPQALAALLTLPVVLSRNEIGIKEAQGGLLHSNLSFLAPETGGEVLRGFLTSFDLFWLWSFVLLALGYHLVARVSRTTATLTVFVLWLLWVGIHVGPPLLVSLMKGHS